MSRPRILDLFCGAGGAAMGYHHAGFDVVGVDEVSQPRYPFTFYKGDALGVINWRDFDAVHASPPCKVHTALSVFSSPWHIDLIPQTRKLLESSGLPYVIENVPGAITLRSDLTLCGSTFKLGVRRHRLFELSGFKVTQPDCDHAGQAAASPKYMVKRYNTGKPIITPSPVIGVYGHGQGLGEGEVQMWRDAMDIQWMVRDELSQAIPPAYTEYIGRQLMEQL